MTFLKKLFLILISNPDKKFLEAADLYAHLSDEELVERIVANNDPLLFGKLYDRYAKMVYNKCYGFAKSEGEAEDLTQDVFLQLFIKLGTFRENPSSPHGCIPLPITFVSTMSNATSSARYGTNPYR